MDVSISPSIVIITSLFEDHLDYHGSVDAYEDAKKNAVRFQSDKDLVFIPEGDNKVLSIAKESSGTIKNFSTDDVSITIH